jgi:hypothetical protein
MAPSPSASSPMATSRSRSAMSQRPGDAAVGGGQGEVAVRWLVRLGRPAPAAAAPGPAAARHRPQPTHRKAFNCGRPASCSATLSMPLSAIHCSTGWAAAACARPARLPAAAGIGRFALLGPVLAGPAAAPWPASALHGQQEARFFLAVAGVAALARGVEARAQFAAWPAALGSPSNLAAKARRSSSTSARPRSFSRASTSAGRPRSSRKSAWRPAGRHRAGPAPALRGRRPRPRPSRRGVLRSPPGGSGSTGAGRHRPSALPVPGAAWRPRRRRGRWWRPVAPGRQRRSAAAPVRPGLATDARAAVVAAHHLDGQLPGPGPCVVRVPAPARRQVGQRGIELVIKLQHLRAQHTHRHRWVRAGPTRAAARPACSRCGAGRRWRPPRQNSVRPGAARCRSCGRGAPGLAQACSSRAAGSLARAGTRSSTWASLLGVKAAAWARGAAHSLVRPAAR